ncbi:MAG: glycosyltransferase family 39 protein [Candidatus Micrarchaeota archaeon]|nr:glycosyltransferase family 39 protein [Candidatus Micrarchaeota archaeon]
MLLGYLFTLSLSLLLASLLALLIRCRKELFATLSPIIDYKLALVPIACILFFFLFSIMFVSPAEQLYFDENIYQGIAINILAHGNALWCQYGSGLLTSCFTNSIYHDAIGYPFLLSIAFLFFGIGINTAFAMQLFIGLLSIAFFFLLSSILFQKRMAIAASTIIFTLIPQLFIWSRAQAIPDLALMCFAILTFFLFVFFTREPKLERFALFASALVFTIYMRIEGILLLPIFAVLFFAHGADGIRETMRKRLGLVIDSINNNTKFLALSLFFFVLLMPEIYYLAIQISNPSYGQDYTGQQVFSVANFMNNIGPNVLFFLGNYNSVSQFPLGFPVETTALAGVGILLLLMSKSRNKYGTILLLALWLFAYHLFYDFFYAGAATFGVDVRFMLELCPALALLAGIGISELSELVGGAIKSPRLGLMFYLLVLLGGVIVPFALFVPNITLKPQQMPQQTVIYDALSFFYSNYNKVPAGCMVYTFTPDLWYEFNRSAAQINYLGSSDPQFVNDTRGYSCSVIDYGYWCSVPPYKGTTCKNLVQSYNLVTLASQNNTARGENFAFYKIVGKKG